MKTKVKATYPLLARHIKRRLREKGWSRMKVGSQMEKIKPDYQSKSGRVKRYSSEVPIPEAPKQPYVITGTGKDLRITQTPKASDKIRFTGSYEECKTVLATAVHQWWSLPRGQEIETAAAARTEFPKTAEKP